VTQSNESDAETTAVGGLLADMSDENGQGTEGAQVSNEPPLLFPLDSNREQRQVARLASRCRVLAVHGPPGTGKSPPILNLLRHLAAQGKTVLLTSQKDKALEVVRNKLPEINYLAMALLRSDKESQQLLLQALENYAADLADTSAEELARRRAFLYGRINK